MKTRIFHIICIVIVSLVTQGKGNAQSLEEQKEMLRLVNELRAERGLQPLYLNQELNRAAQVHSEDQAANNFLGHTGTDGSSFGQRVRRTDYDGAPRAENVAAGNATAANTFMQWKKSSSHRKNMLLSDINQMGLGHGVNQNAKYTHYWTQVFGKGNNVLSVGSIDVKSTNPMTISPNPFQEVFTIKFESRVIKPLELLVATITGVVIKRIQINPSTEEKEINLSGFPLGVYFLHAEERHPYKIIKS